MDKELSRMKNDLKDWMLGEIEEKLAEWVGYEINVDEMADRLFEGNIVDGTYTYSTKDAKNWIIENFEDIGEIVENLQANYGEIVNCFLYPEKFQVEIVFELANYMINSSDFIKENINERIKLTQEIADKIIQEICNNCDTWGIYD